VNDADRIGDTISLSDTSIPLAALLMAALFCFTLGNLLQSDTKRPQIPNRLVSGAAHIPLCDIGLSRTERTRTRS
jgi:hypothetical protein